MEKVIIVVISLCTQFKTTPITLFLVPMVLVGTMADERLKNLDYYNEDFDLVDQSFAKSSAALIGACDYIECSSYSFSSISEAFRIAIQAVIESNMDDEEIDGFY